jgi:hypothetical protein
LAQDEVLQGELAMTPQRNGRSRSKWSRKVIIELILSGSELTDQPLPAGRSFGEGQVPGEWRVFLVTA